MRFAAANVRVNTAGDRCLRAAALQASGMLGVSGELGVEVPARTGVPVLSVKGRGRSWHTQAFQSGTRCRA